MGEYTCDNCGESFDDPSAIGGHVASCGTDYDGAGEYTCDNCGKEFDNPKKFAGHKSGCGELPWDDPELLKRLYHEEKLSTFEIADRFEEAEQTSVYYQLKKHGIETRSVGDSIRNRFASNLTVHLQNGRIQFFFDAFGETHTFLLSQLVALLDNPAEEVFDDTTHVHHKNHMPFDDRPENIEVLDGSEHSRYHGEIEAKRRDRNAEGDFV